MSRLFVNSRAFSAAILIGLTLVMVTSYQNCGGDPSFRRVQENKSNGDLCAGIPNCTVAPGVDIAAAVRNGGNQNIGFEENLCGNLDPQQIADNEHRHLVVDLFSLNFRPKDFLCKRLTPYDNPLDLTHLNCNLALRPDGGENEVPPRIGEYRQLDAEGRHIQLEFLDLVDGEYEIEYVGVVDNGGGAEVRSNPIRIKFFVEDCDGNSSTTTTTVSTTTSTTQSGGGTSTTSTSSSSTSSSSSTTSSSTTTTSMTTTSTSRTTTSTTRTTTTTSRTTTTSSSTSTTTSSSTSTSTSTTTTSTTTTTFYRNYNVQGVSKPPIDNVVNNILTGTRSEPVFTILNSRHPFYRVEVTATGMSGIINNLMCLVGSGPDCLNFAKCGSQVVASPSQAAENINLTLPGCQLYPDVDTYNFTIYGLYSADGANGPGAQNSPYPFTVDAPRTGLPNDSLKIEVLGVHAPSLDTVVDNNLTNTNLNPTFRVKQPVIASSGIAVTEALTYDVLIRAPYGDNPVVCKDTVQSVKVVGQLAYDITLNNCIIFPNANNYRVDIIAGYSGSTHKASPFPYLFNVLGGSVLAGDFAINGVHKPAPDGIDEKVDDVLYGSNMNPVVQLERGTPSIFRVEIQDMTKPAYPLNVVCVRNFFGPMNITQINVAVSSCQLRYGDSYHVHAYGFINGRPYSAKNNGFVFRVTPSWRILGMIPSTAGATVPGNVMLNSSIPTVVFEDSSSAFYTAYVFRKGVGTEAKRMYICGEKIQAPTGFVPGRALAFTFGNPNCRVYEGYEYGVEVFEIDPDDNEVGLDDLGADNNPYMFTVQGVREPVTFRFNGSSSAVGAIDEGSEEKVTLSYLEAPKPYPVTVNLRLYGQQASDCPTNIVYPADSYPFGGTKIVFCTAHIDGGEVSFLEGAVGVTYSVTIPAGSNSVQFKLFGQKDELMEYNQGFRVGITGASSTINYAYNNTAQYTGRLIDTSTNPNFAMRLSNVLCFTRDIDEVANGDVPNVTGIFPGYSGAGQEVDFDVTVEQVPNRDGTTLQAEENVDYTISRKTIRVRVNGWFAIQSDGAVITAIQDNKSEKPYESAILRLKSIRIPGYNGKGGLPLSKSDPPVNTSGPINSCQGYANAVMDLQIYDPPAPLVSYNITGVNGGNDTVFDNKLTDPNAAPVIAWQNAGTSRYHLRLICDNQTLVDQEVASACTSTSCRYTHTSNLVGRSNCSVDVTALRTNRYFEILDKLGASNNPFAFVIDKGPINPSINIDTRIEGGATPGFLVYSNNYQASELTTNWSIQHVPEPQLCPNGINCPGVPTCTLNNKTSVSFTLNCSGFDNWSNAGALFRISSSTSSGIRTETATRDVRVYFCSGGYYFNGDYCELVDDGGSGAPASCPNQPGHLLCWEDKEYHDAALVPGCISELAAITHNTFRHSTTVPDCTSVTSTGECYYTAPQYRQVNASICASYCLANPNRLGCPGNSVP